MVSKIGWDNFALRNLLEHQSSSRSRNRSRLPASSPMVSSMYRSIPLELRLDGLERRTQVLRPHARERHDGLLVRQWAGFEPGREHRQHVPLVVYGLVGEQVVLEHSLRRHAERVVDEGAGEPGAVLAGRCSARGIRPR